MSRLPASRTNPYQAPTQPRVTADWTGPLELVAGPAGRALTLAEVRRHLRMTDDDPADDDALLLGLIDGATDYAERSIDGGRQLVSATYRLPMAGFWHGAFRFPRPPLQALGALEYYAAGGTLTTLASSKYLVSTPLRGPGTLERGAYQVWPAVQADRRYPVQATFTCGYGPGTTLAAAVGAGTRTVTPATMFGIYAGTRLLIGDGTDQEAVTVTAVTGATFTAVFAQDHPAAPVPVLPGIPPAVRQALLMWVKDRYDGCDDGKGGATQAIDRLLASAVWGSYA